MRTVVTGGAGFIGSHLVDLLLGEGHQVLVLDSLVNGRPGNLEGHRDNPALERKTLDIRDRERLAGSLEGADWVFHLAALADIVPSIQSPGEYFTTNVDGTFNVLEEARRAEVKRLVYAASSSCYGIPESYPTPESAEIRPQYPYALTKYLGEELVLHWAQIYGVPALSLRLFNVYGPRSRPSGTYGAVFGVFLRQKLAEKPFTVVGDGKQTRDFTFVTDVANAFLTAAKSDLKGEVFNVGSGEHHSVNELVQLLEGEAVFIPKRPGEPDCTFADTARIQERLGWKPRVPFPEGVRLILEQIDYWRESPLWDPESIAEATSDWFTYLGKKEG